MKIIPKTLLYGFLLWLSVLVIAMFMFQIREDNQIFFETLITITICFFTSVFAVSIFQSVKANHFKVGLIVGAIWMAMNLILDYPMFTFGPMQMGFMEYFKDIGLTYLVMPIITASMGLAIENGRS